MSEEMNEFDSDEWEAPPPSNMTPPTPFELASLAATYQLKGRTEEESFDAATRVFQEAERRLQTFMTQDERRRESAINLFKNIPKEDLAKVEPILAKLGCQIPSRKSFPIESEEFHERLCAQRNIEDRRRQIEKLTKKLGQEMKAPFWILTFEGWLKLVEALVEEKELLNPAKLKSHDQKLRSQKRGVKKEFKPVRPSTIEKNKL